MARVCMGCDATITSGPRERNARKWCSEACRVRTFRHTKPAAQQAIEERSRVKRLAESAARAESAPRVACEACGAQVVQSRHDRRYCSSRCRAVVNAQLRRAREAGVKITAGARWRVFERDGWVCQICLEPTDRDADFPDRKYPTIDHIIPLAAGGEHAEANWQTACHSCNSSKGSRVMV